MGENQETDALLRVIPPIFDPLVEGREVRLTRHSSSWVLSPFWLGEGFPADVRRIFSALDEREPHWRQNYKSEARFLPLPVFVARRMSAGARELLESEGISWADTVGRAEIAIPGEVYISRLPPIPGDAGRPFRWSLAAVVVAEWLLSRAAGLPHDERSAVERVNVVADATDLSLAHVARVLRMFDEQQYTIKTGAERGSSATREFRDLGRLFSDWAAHYIQISKGGGVEFSVPWRDPERTIEVLQPALGDFTWAVTGAAAADLVAPHLTSVPTVDIYVNKRHERDALGALRGMRNFTEVTKGGRVRLFFERPQAFEQTIERNGVRVMSPIRVYADLLKEGGRSVEAAEFLRESIIGF